MTNYQYCREYIVHRYPHLYEYIEIAFQHNER